MAESNPYIATEEPLKHEVAPAWRTFIYGEAMFETFLRIDVPFGDAGVSVDHAVAIMSWLDIRHRLHRALSSPTSELPAELPIRVGSFPLDDLDTVVTEVRAEIIGAVRCMESARLAFDDTLLLAADVVLGLANVLLHLPEPRGLLQRLLSCLASGRLWTSAGYMKAFSHAAARHQRCTGPFVQRQHVKPLNTLHTSGHQKE